MRAYAALLIAFSLGLAACNQSGGNSTAAGGGGGSGPVTQEDMSLGPATAKVNVVEYASVGCPVCAGWANDNWDAFKTKYIDSGKIHYTLKEMNNGDASVAAAGFLLARCAGADKYFTVVESAYRQEAPYLEKQGVGQAQRDELQKIAQSAGLSEEQFTSCITNEDQLNAFNDRVQKHHDADHVDATPTFMINGKTCDDCMDPKAMDKAIADAAAAPK